MVRSFLGTFLGKLAAAAFIAACVALGVGPDWWAKEILAVQPVWYLRAGLVLLAVVTAGECFRGGQQGGQRNRGQFFREGESTWARRTCGQCCLYGGGY